MPQTSHRARSNDHADFSDLPIVPSDGLPDDSQPPGFLASAGAAIAATEMGLFDFASSAFGGEAQPAGKPVVNAVFIRPAKAPDVDWPGGNCDIPAQQALFTKTLRTAAEKWGVDLRVQDQPIATDAETGRLPGTTEEDASRRADRGAHVVCRVGSRCNRSSKTGARFPRSSTPT